MSTVANDFEAIRQALYTDSQIMAYIGYANGNHNEPNIYYVNCPPDINADNVIVMNYSELSGGSYARDYQLDVTIISKRYIDCATIKERVIELLDRFYGEYGLATNIGSVRSITLNNGNSIIFNQEDDKYYSMLYFHTVL